MTTNHLQTLSSPNSSPSPPSPGLRRASDDLPTEWPRLTPEFFSRFSLRLRSLQRHANRILAQHVLYLERKNFKLRRANRELRHRRTLSQLGLSPLELEELAESEGDAQTVEREIHEAKVQFRALKRIFRFMKD